MPRVTANVAGSQNRCIFLDLIAWSEGTSTQPRTKDDGYDVIVTGVDGLHNFNDYTDHPNLLVVVNRTGLKSTAAGRYQLLYKYWRAYKRQLGLLDFSPLSQDRIALQQVKEQGALPDIDRGDISSAIQKCSNIWASFPGNNYGQNPHRIDLLLKIYGKFAIKV